MKLKNLITYKTKLTTLNLINAKIFSKETTSENVSIDQIKYQLTKALKIIYKFHVNDKKILFIGKLMIKY
jgi:ribosomal protein S2